MSEIIQFLKEKQTALTACSKQLTAKQMIQATSIAIYQNRALAKCSKESIYEAVLQAARMGLDCSGLHGHGYLVPYGRQCKFIPGWRGLASIAKRASGVTDIKANVIRANDEYDWCEGLDPDLKHKPSLDKDRGEIVAAYAVAWLENGKRRFEVVEKWKLDDLQRDSRSDSWQKHFEAMAKKTAIRRLCDALPRTLELADALDLELAAEENRQPAEILRMSEPDLLAKNPDNTAEKVKQTLKKRGRKPRKSEVARTDLQERLDGLKDGHDRNLAQDKLLETNDQQEQIQPVLDVKVDQQIPELDDVDNIPF